MKVIKNKKGFSFLEVMITIAVLSVGILGVMVLMVSSMKSSMNSRDGIIASELAQEGIELIRNIRDNSLINSEEIFSSGFPAGSSSNCRIDMNSTSISCDNGTNHKKLYFDGKFYAHNSGGTETKFQRKIMVDNYLDSDGNPTNFNSAARVDLYSIVIWGTDWPSGCDSCNMAGKCVCVKDVLTEWR